MELGIHLGTFPRSTLAESLDAAVRHGFSCVHLNLKAAGLPSMPDALGEDQCGAIAGAIRDRGLRVATLSGTFNMIHPDAGARRDGLRRLRVLAKRAECLGASVITLCTGTRHPTSMWRRHPDNDRDDAWRDLVASMEEALAVAEACDVTLAIEPEVSNVIDSAAKARRLLDRMGSERLKIVMDGANLFHAGELPRMRDTLVEAFDLLGPDIVVGHAKDLDRDGEAGHLAAGTGLLDYPFYLSEFARVGFDGPLILHGLDESQVEASVAMLRDTGVG